MHPTEFTILQAIHELGRNGAFVKSARVLTRAIERAGLLTPQRRAILQSELDASRHEVIDRFHAALLALVHEADPPKQLVIGQGNFGLPDGSMDPANPLFTECRLSEAGRAYLEASLHTMPLDEIYRYFRSYDKASYEVFAQQGSEPTLADVAAFESRIGFRFPDEFRESGKSLN